MPDKQEVQLSSAQSPFTRLKEIYLFHRVGARSLLALESYTGVASFHSLSLPNVILKAELQIILISRCFPLLSAL